MKEAPTKAGIQGMTLTEVKGFGRHKEHTELYRGAEYTVDFLPRVKIQILVPDDKAVAVADVIAAVARAPFDWQRACRLRYGPAANRSNTATSTNKQSVF